MQRASQFDIQTFAADAAGNFSRLNNPDFRVVQRQFVGFVKLCKLTAVFLQLVQLNPHNRALWTDRLRQEQSAKSLIITGRPALSKRGRTAAAISTSAAGLSLCPPWFLWRYCRWGRFGSFSVQLGALGPPHRFQAIVIHDTTLAEHFDQAFDQGMIR